MSRNFIYKHLKLFAPFFFLNVENQSFGWSFTRWTLADFAAHLRRQPVQLLVKQRRAFANKVLAQSTEESSETLETHPKRPARVRLRARRGVCAAAELKVLGSKQETDVYLKIFAHLSWMYAPQTLTGRNTIGYMEATQTFPQRRPGYADVPHLYWPCM